MSKEKECIAKPELTKQLIASTLKSLARKKPLDKISIRERLLIRSALTGRRSTITIMSSLALEESRSISENVTWGMRKRFADGKVSMPYKVFLGYRKGANGQPEIVPAEYATVEKLVLKEIGR